MATNAEKVLAEARKWLGHKDGGALAMKVYGHLRDQHSEEMAARVSFSTTQEAGNVTDLKKRRAA